MTAPVFIALTQKGSNLASKLAKTLSGATVHGLRRRTKDADEIFDDTVAHLKNLFIAKR